MPSPETIELKHVKDTQGVSSDLPSNNARATISAKIRELVLRTSNLPLLRHIYGGSKPNKTLTLAAGEYHAPSIFSDGTYLYNATYTTPVKIVKIDTSTFTRYDVLTFATGENGPGGIVSDGSKLYVALRMSPSRIIRIDIQTFAIDSRLDLNINDITNLYLDGTFLYAGNNVSRIAKIDVETFTQIATLNIGGDRSIISIVSDETFLYVGTSDNTGGAAAIYRIDISTFTFVSSLSFGVNAGAIYLTMDGDFLYASINPITGSVIHKISLQPFNSVGTLTTTNEAGSIVTNGTYLYAPIFRPLNAVGLLAVINLDTFTLKRELTLTVANPMSIIVDPPFLYIGFQVIPGKITRYYLIPTDSASDRRINIISTNTNLLPTIDTNIDTINTNVSSIETNVDTINTNVTSIETKVDTLTTNLAITDGKVDTLTANLALVATDVTAILGMLSTAGVRYRTSAGTTGIQVFGGAGAYVRGGYVEAIAANAVVTTFYIESMTIYTGSGGAGNFYEVDIATGGIDAENVIATVVHKLDGGTAVNDYVFPNPIEIAANTRVAVSCGSSPGTGENVWVTLRYRVTP